MKRTFILALLLGAGSTAAIPAATVHVKPGADPANSASGASWAAATNLQRALAIAEDGDEIWLMSGVYFPDEGEGASPDDRASTFLMKLGVAVYGGFAGTETALEQRANPPAAPTVLSGDLTQDDADPDGDGIIGAAGDVIGTNSYHVVTVPANYREIIDRLAITAGRANGTNFSDKEGAAVLINTASPELVDCTISGHQGFDAVNARNRTPTFTRCTFRGCSGNAISAARTSGMLFDGCDFTANENSPVRLSVASATIQDCRFTANVVPADGGAINNSQSSPTILRCAFTGNECGRNGGAIYNNGRSSPTIRDCVFTGNYADRDGGAIYNDFESSLNTYYSNPKIINCTIAGNYSDDDGGGIYNNGDETIIANCIIWNNISDSDDDNVEANIINFSGADPVITNSLVGFSGGSGAGWNPDGGADGGGNLDADPLFAASINPLDAPAAAGDARLTAGSPAIDAGDAGATTSATDQTGGPRVIGAAVDLGAIEFDPSAPGGVDADLDIGRVEVGGQDYIALTYSVPEAMQGEAAFQVQRFSPANPNWVNAAGLVPVSESVQDGRLFVTLRLPAVIPAEPAVIYRLAITQ